MPKHTLWVLTFQGAWNLHIAWRKFWYCFTFMYKLKWALKCPLSTIQLIHCMWSRRVKCFQANQNCCLPLPPTKPTASRKPSHTLVLSVLASKRSEVYLEGYSENHFVFTSSYSPVLFHVCILPEGLSVSPSLLLDPNSGWQKHIKLKADFYKTSITSTLVHLVLLSSWVWPLGGTSRTLENFSFPSILDRVTTSQLQPYSHLLQRWPHEDKYLCVVGTSSLSLFLLQTKVKNGSLVWSIHKFLFLFIIHCSLHLFFIQFISF